VVPAESSAGKIMEGFAMRNVMMVGAVGAARLCRAGVAGDVYDVTLDGMDFVYNGMTNMDIDLTVEVGDTVRWTWVSGFHNVVSGFPGDPDEGVLFESGEPTDEVGMTFSYTFLETGVVGYHCEIHEDMGMISQVTVVPGPGAAGLLVPAGLLGLRRRR
jgi:plastocyanin